MHMKAFLYYVYEMYSTVMDSPIRAQNLQIIHATAGTTTQLHRS